jgi:hypothetical protein
MSDNALNEPPKPAVEGPKMDQVKSFLAGGAAGISAVLVGVSWGL